MSPRVAAPICGGQVVGYQRRVLPQLELGTVGSIRQKRSMPSSRPSSPSLMQLM
jgi:hypothetical protein